MIFVPRYLLNSRFERLSQLLHLALAQLIEQLQGQGLAAQPTDQRPQDGIYSGRGFGQGGGRAEINQAAIQAEAGAAGSLHLGLVN